MAHKNLFLWKTRTLSPLTKFETTWQITLAPSTIGAPTVIPQRV